MRIAAAGLTSAAIICAAAPAPRAQAVPAIDERITYILPQWAGFLGASSADLAQQVAELRSRIGEGPRVKVGFTTYILVSMAPVDPADPAAVRTALASTFAQMDEAIARARANGIPICLSFITAIRGETDALQDAAQAEDRRNMQWHSDNSLAPGWTTFSRYARKQEAIQEAYVREIGRQLAARMALYPDTLVAASGDGEIELANDQGYLSNSSFTPETSRIADFSPFTIAEFRDWLRQAGLYAPGQNFAGQAWTGSARYVGPDGLSHLNEDFGTSFQTWDLRYFNWSLADPIAPDPGAIPVGTYGQSGWLPLPATNDTGFDAPRSRQPGAWRDMWEVFRQTMVWRHNLEFAQWITTSTDPASGARVPTDRWYTDQIPADYVFGTTPASKSAWLEFSGSPWWTADVSPFGSTGITSFNVNFGGSPEQFGRTLAGVAPAIAARKLRWAVLEWNPSSGPSSQMSIYDQERQLVELYRPSVLAPFAWLDTTGSFRVDNTNFEIMLHELVNDLNHVPLTLSRAELDIGTTTTGTSRSPAQTVRVSGVPGETPAWSITSAPSYLDVVPSTDGRSFTVALKPGTYAAGTVTSSIVVSPSEPGYVSATLAVSLEVILPSATLPPQGAVDTPIDNAVVTGEVPVTGWAVDDLGLSSLTVCRDAVAGETAQVDSRCGGQPLIFIGNGTFVPGARPDVLAQFPGVPLNDQAGWGYMLMSNMLPNGGTGTFTLSVFASDVDGHTTLLPQRHIVCQNSSAQLPFGTIDTPKQGETISGSQYVNFGWTLTQLGKDVPADSSTIQVYVDNVPVGHPGVRAARSDITVAFRGYDASHAVGGYVLDTTQLSNGVHSIFWVVTDTSGATQGVGSRFFTVANP